MLLRFEFLGVGFLQGMKNSLIHFFATLLDLPKGA